MDSWGNPPGMHNLVIPIAFNSDQLDQMVQAMSEYSAYVSGERNTSRRVRGTLSFVCKVETIVGKFL